jgi:plasmid stabilization system protein ParE
VLPLELHPAASEEVEEAYTWYQRKASGAIADEFLDEIDRAVDAICEMPNTWPSYIQGTRRFLLRRFPYTIVYRLDGDTVRVIAVAHQRRRPAYWRVRLRHS